MLKPIRKNVVFVLVFVVILSVTLFISPFLRIQVLSIVKNPLQIFTIVGKEIKGLVFYHRNYVQNERLRNEVNLLRQMVVKAEEVSRENQRLKNMLSFKKNATFKVISARVIGRFGDNWSSVIIIDKGSRSGIQAGQVVLSYLSLLGRIIETGPDTSKVLLINDPDFSVSAIVQRSRQEGLVTGTLGNSLIMKYLPKDADINVSDAVLTSGLTRAYPKGILIGIVTDVGEEFSGLSRYAIIKPATNLSNVEEVLIIVG